MNKLLVLFIFLGLLAPVFFVSANSGNTAGYAWSNSVGWINFGCNKCNVQVSNSGITGYAWSQNYGWINLGPLTAAGVKNSAGTLSGNAWGQNLGWINFVSVAINSQGQFTGTASGNMVGTVAFTNCGSSCGVQTTWRPSVSCATDDDCDFGLSCINSVCAETSGGSQPSGSCATDDDCDFGLSCINSVCTETSGGSQPPSDGSGGTQPSGGNIGTLSGTGGNGLSFASNSLSSSSSGNYVLINGGATQTDNPAVELTLNGGSNVIKMEISANPNFTGATPQDYGQTTSFNLSGGDGQKIIYVKFINAAGQASQTVSASIILNTEAADLTIGQIKNYYSPNDDVIISGTAGAASEVIFEWDSQYGLATADNNGKWSADFGKMSAGTHYVSIFLKNRGSNAKILSIVVAKDQGLNTGNTTPAITTPNVPASVKPASPTIQAIIKQFRDSISQFFAKNPQPAASGATNIISIPKEAPEVLMHKWNLLPINTQSNP